MGLTGSQHGGGDRCMKAQGEPSVGKESNGLPVQEVRTPGSQVGRGPLK